jgi:hypothetical protein
MEEYPASHAVDAITAVLERRTGESTSPGCSPEVESRSECLPARHATKVSRTPTGVMRSLFN